MEYAITCKLKGMSRGRRISVAPNGDATFAPNRMAASLWPSREAAQEYAERAMRHNPGIELSLTSSPRLKPGDSSHPDDGRGFGF